MKKYLVFQLYAPMAAWGEEAVGENRHTDNVPTQSAILGLIGAAAGIRRDNTDILDRLANGYSIAIQHLSTGQSWLRDFHTVNSFSGRQTPYTRKDELTFGNMNTMISRREYVCDGYWRIAVSEKDGAPFSLEEIKGYLDSPQFPLYLGRKSCPLALPLCPTMVEGTLRQAFLDASEKMPAGSLSSLVGNMTVCYWDDPDESSIECQKIETRNHHPINRERWQFAPMKRFSGVLTEDK